MSITANPDSTNWQNPCQNKKPVSAETGDIIACSYRDKAWSDEPTSSYDSGDKVIQISGGQHQPVYLHRATQRLMVDRFVQLCICEITFSTAEPAIIHPSNKQYFAIGQQRRRMAFAWNGKRPCRTPST